MKVLAFGEILWDIIDGEPFLGGAPLNFAAHIARWGNEVFMVSSIGNDNLGWRALNEARTHNVDCSYVGIHPAAPTGTVDVFLNNGEPDYNIHEHVAFDDIQPDDRLHAERFDVLYYGTLARRQLSSAASFRKILANMTFDHLFCDINLRKNGWDQNLIIESLRCCTILKLNMQELPSVVRSISLSGTSPETFCRQITLRFSNIRAIVVTDGSNGCFVFQDGHLTHIPGVPVQIIDGIGAGDAFSAVFMHVFAKTADAREAAALANRIGAFVASSRAAIPEYNREIRELITMVNAALK